MTETQRANLRKGTAAAQYSPRGGRHELHHRAKYWIVLHLPSQTRYTVRNLLTWCRNHPDLFAPHTWEHAYAGLQEVGKSLAGRRKHSVSRWREWTLLAPPRVPDPAYVLAKWCNGWQGRHAPRELPLAAFQRARSGFLGRTAWCADCCNARWRAWNAANPTGRREQRRVYSRRYTQQYPERVKLWKQRNIQRRKNRDAPS
ncbi:MAG: hypothetical protein IVW57_12280 [Ktedonobacterales bacterium]|nr:hypothetical protein [Ktedonobacterales bacterium]